MTKNNILANAKFRDNFMTRDGKLAVYHKRVSNGYHALITDDPKRDTIFCKDNGQEVGYILSQKDVIYKF